MNLVFQYLRFQLFREKLYRPLRMLCRCLPWMILSWMILPLDACSSSLKVLQSAAVSFAVKCAMQISKELRWCTSYTHLPSSKAFSDFAFTKMQWANVCNFSQFEFRSDVSSNLLQPLSSKVWIFRKIQEADSLSVGVYGSSLVVKRNTAIIFQLELIPNEISSQETVALKKSLLDER